MPIEVHSHLAQKYKSYQTDEMQLKTVFRKNGQLKDDYNTWLILDSG